MQLMANSLLINEFYQLPVEMIIIDQSMLLSKLFQYKALIIVDNFIYCDTMPLMD